MMEDWKDVGETDYMQDSHLFADEESIFNRLAAYSKDTRANSAIWTISGIHHSASRPQVNTGLKGSTYLVDSNLAKMGGAGTFDIRSRTNMNKAEYWNGYDTYEAEWVLEIDSTLAIVYEWFAVYRQEILFDLNLI